MTFLFWQKEKGCILLSFWIFKRWMEDHLFFIKSWWNMYFSYRWTSDRLLVNWKGKQKVMFHAVIIACDLWDIYYLFYQNFYSVDIRSLKNINFFPRTALLANRLHRPPIFSRRSFMHFYIFQSNSKYWSLLG